MSSSSSSITPELLDALLTPSGSAGPSSSPRSHAESRLQSLPVQARATSLLALLLDLYRNPAPSSASDPNHASRQMLAAVLLRRDVASLGGMASSSSSASEATSLLNEMARPLLDMFLDGGGSALSGPARRQVGHCLAELCLSSSLLSAEGGDATMAGVLTGIGPACTAADATSLLLLSNLADRSPITLWRAAGTNGEALAALFQGVLATLQAAAAAPQAQQPNADQVEAALEAVIYVGIASDAAAAAAGSDGGGDGSDLVRAIRSQTEAAEGNVKDGKVDPSSPASHLGRACLPFILGLVLGMGDEEAQRRCMERLSHCSARCPSLLAGDTHTLTCLVRTCIAVAQSHGGAASAAAAAADHDDAATVALSALEVLATICDVTAVRKRIVLSSNLAGGSDGSIQDLLRMLLLGPDATGPSDQNGVVRIAAELIVNGVDDDLDGWRSEPPSLQADACSSWDGDDSAMYAESLLETFLRNLGGGTSTLPVVLPLVETLLATETWQNKRAALSMLERCLDAAPVTFSRHVPVAAETALGLASHPCERVQIQALQLLGSLCHADAVSDSSDGGAEAHPIREVRARYGGRMLRALTELVGSPCGKIASHACLAIVSYCRGGNGKEDCGASVQKELLVPYLPGVLAALVSGPLSVDITIPSNVNDGAITVLVRAISAVACLADAAGEDFAPYYADVMPGLLGCAQFGLETSASPNGHDLATLRGSAVESATIVGEAVAGSGSENAALFVPDAERIVGGVILPVLKAAESSSSDDAAAASVVPMDQLLAASARIANVMGDRYAQFVPAVLPHLLKRATEEAEVSVVEGDDAGLEATKREGCEYDEELGTESITVALPGMGLRKLVLNTTQMQEKAQAARAVYEHALALGASFGPFAADCIAAFLPLVNFKYSAEVRSTSAQALAPVFDSACQYAVAANSGNDAPTKALQSITKAIVHQLQVEDKDDEETVFALADSLSDILYSAYNHTSEANRRRVAQLSINDARVTVKQLIGIVKSCLERRSVLIGAIAGSDGVIPDEDEKAQLSEQLMAEGKNLTPLVDSIGFTLKSLGEGFAPVFDGVVAPFFAPFLTSTGTNDVRARVAAVCLFDDGVEHCGSAVATKHSPKLAEAVLEGIDDSSNQGDADLKSASVYGIAQIARHAPNNVFDRSINNVIGYLTIIIKSVDGMAKEEVEDLRLVENSVSALVSLALFDNAPYAKSGSFDRKSLVDLFLDNLPLREDEDEAQICHDGLCDLIESGSISIASESSRLVGIIGQVLEHVNDGEEIATPGTCARLGNILNQMQQQVSSDAMQKSFVALSPEAQAATSAAMKHAATTYGSNGSPACVTKIY